MGATKRLLRRLKPTNSMGAQKKVSWTMQGKGQIVPQQSLNK